MKIKTKESLEGLKQLRQSKNLTQQSVAEHIGVKRNTVCQWEHGKRVPSVAMVRLLAKLFNCQVESLFIASAVCKRNKRR